MQFLDLLPISSGLVIGAGVLACIGIGYLFPDKIQKKTNRKSLEVSRDPFFTYQRNIFEFLSRYLLQAYLDSGYLESVDFQRNYLYNQALGGRLV